MLGHPGCAGILGSCFLSAFEATLPNITIYTPRTSVFLEERNKLLLPLGKSQIMRVRTCTSVPLASTTHKPNQRHGVASTKKWDEERVIVNAEMRHCSWNNYYFIPLHGTTTSLSLCMEKLIVYPSVVDDDNRGILCPRFSLQGSCFITTSYVHMGDKGEHYLVLFVDACAGAPVSQEQMLFYMVTESI